MELIQTNVRHILGVDDYTPELLESLFLRAAQFKKQVKARQKLDINLDTIDPAVSFFVEPSTRTRFSSEFALKRLGFDVIETEAAKVFSSLSKGESLSDAARNLNGYQPSIVIARTSGDNDAVILADNLKCPVINAGSGKGEHPTQAGLDLFTIWEKKGRLEDLKVVVGGDLANGRTAKSLTKLLAEYKGNQFVLISPDPLKMDPEIIQLLKDKGVKYIETSDMDSALKNADVVYWTRLQAERFGKDRQAKQAMIKLQSRFCITNKQMSLMEDDAILMHPLPRVEEGYVDSDGDLLQPEILPEVDTDSRAIFFEQSENGLYFRMALIEWLLGRGS